VALSRKPYPSLADWLHEVDPSGLLDAIPEYRPGNPRRFRLMGAAMLRAMPSFHSADTLLKIADQSDNGACPCAIREWLDPHKWLARQTGPDWDRLREFSVPVGHRFLPPSVALIADGRDSLAGLFRSLASAIQMHLGDGSGLVGRFCHDVCDIIRDVSQPPAWTTGGRLLWSRCPDEWRTDTVLTLARHIWNEREFGTMPILADALQDAGCDNEAVLNHCRHPHGPHVRGCWALDAILGH
jgi:hypothetical protein